MLEPRVAPDEKDWWFDDHLVLLYEITGEPQRLRSTLMNGIEHLPAVLVPTKQAAA